jgi:Ca-activated chloride channel family protein
MDGAGEAQLKEALRNLLDQETAKKYLLSAGEQDENIFILFNSGIKQIISVSGNDPRKLLEAYQIIRSAKPGGGTDMYTPVLRAFQLMGGYNAADYISAVIVMTDGESEDYFREFSGIYQANSLGSLDLPVFSIMFGDANQTQLDALAELTRARVFDGKTDLTAAFKNAKGYN